MKSLSRVQSLYNLTLVNISDRTALPCPSEDSPEVYSLWSMATNEEFSAKLAGSLTGPVCPYIQ